MDVQRFGSFIQSCRKELGMTQGELGAKLNVTDKAISRWERGVGFPDIKLLEPLAEALQISIQELMQCEKNEPDQIAPEMTDEEMIDTQKIGKSLWLGKYRRMLAAISFLLYALFRMLAGNALFYGQLDWLSPLVKLLFLITIGSFLYASYQEDNHGKY